MSQTLADLTRRVENLLAIGTIAAVDNSAVPPMAKAVVAGRDTGWMPQPQQIGHNYRRWSPLRLGTQVLLASPSGDPANAVIVAILNSTGIPQPDNADSIDLVQWDDGTLVRYDSAAKKLHLLSVGDLTIEATGTVVIEAGNLVTRVRDGGTLHADHAGRASRLTHKDGNLFERESWVAGSVITDLGDNGFSPPRVLSAVEVE